MNLFEYLHRIAATILTVVSTVGAAASAAAADCPCLPETSAVLPDPLVMANGQPVRTRRDWFEKRRPELLEIFSREMHGRMPAPPQSMRFEVFEASSEALQGRATRKQVAIWFSGDSKGPRADLLIYLPKRSRGPVPLILGLNFWGNHAVVADPAVRLSQSYLESGRLVYVDLSMVDDHRANDASRGVNARQWPIEEIVERGYGFATMYREDIASDRPGLAFRTGVHTLYPELQGRLDNFGTIAAWAWGLSRAVDYLETDPAVDASRVAIFGWSRLGKAALWAGASDERIALVLSNESGAGGAKLFRRGRGEDIHRLNNVFPHWFASSFGKYIERDTLLPFDQHMVIALIAPRPVYVGSAMIDELADPEGEFAGAKAADPIYRFLGTEGLPADAWPAPNHAVHGRIGYHVRDGSHDVLSYDWEQYLAFADKFLRPDASTLGSDAP